MTAEAVAAVRFLYIFHPLRRTRIENGKHKHLRAFVADQAFDNGMREVNFHITTDRVRTIVRESSSLREPKQTILDRDNAVYQPIEDTQFYIEHIVQP